MKDASTRILAVLVVATGALVAWQVMERRDVQARIAQLRDAEREAAASSPRDMPRPAPRQHSLAAAHQVATSVSGAPDVWSQLMSTEEGREYRLHMARMAASSNYPDFARVLGLTPSEAGEVLDVLARNALELDAILGPPDRSGVDQAEIHRRLGERRNALDGELAGVLGDRFGQWQAYRKTTSARTALRALQSELAADPMDAKQIDSLADALSAEADRIASERDNRNRANRMLNAAMPFMRPAQLEAYRRTLLREQPQWDAAATAREATLH